MKKSMILPAIILAGNLCTTPVFAYEGNIDTDYLNGTDQGQQVQDDMDKLVEDSQSAREDADSTGRVQSMFEDTQKQFASMKSDYSDLANNYGNIKTIDSSAVYAQYLDSLNTSKKNIGFDEKMDLIKNFDMSSKDSGMKSAFGELKDKVGKELKDKGLNVGALSDKFNVDLSGGKADVMAMNTVNQGAKQYQDVLAKYQAGLKAQQEALDKEEANKKPDAGDLDASTSNKEDMPGFTGEEMGDLSESVGAEFDKAEQEEAKSPVFQSGDNTKGFMSIQDILDNIKNTVK